VVPFRSANKIVSHKRRHRKQTILTLLPNSKKVPTVKIFVPIQTSFLLVLTSFLGKVGAVNLEPASSPKPSRGSLTRL
jgi:hypothetical protein